MRANDLFGAIVATTALLGCTETGKPAGLEQKLAPTPEPAPASEPAPPEPAPLPTRVGRELRLLYRGCARDYGVETIGDEVFVLYTSEGVGRIDHIGPRGERVETFDFDPGVQSRGAYAERFGLAQPKRYRAPRESQRKLDQRWPDQPIGDLLDLEGRSTSDFFVSAEFHVYNETWSTRVAHFHDGAWSPSTELPPWLFVWTGRVMAYGQDTHMGQLGPEFSWVEGDGPKPGFSDLIPVVAEIRGEAMDESQTMGFVVHDFVVTASDKLIALVSYAPWWGESNIPVGTWLATWEAPERSPIVERITPLAIKSGRLVAANGRTFVTLDRNPAFEWREGRRVPLPALGPGDELREVCDPGDDLPRVLGGASDGGLWLIQHECMGRVADGQRRELFALPPGAGGLDGPNDAPWTLDDQDTVWSRATDGVWESHAVVGGRELGDDERKPWLSLTVTGSSEGWLSVTHDVSADHEEIYDPLVRLWVSSDLFTTLPVTEPLDCR